MKGETGTVRDVRAWSLLLFLTAHHPLPLTPGISTAQWGPREIPQRHKLSPAHLCCPAPGVGLGLAWDLSNEEHWGGLHESPALWQASQEWVQIFLNFCNFKRSPFLREPPARVTAFSPKLSPYFYRLTYHTPHTHTQRDSHTTSTTCTPRVITSSGQDSLPGQQSHLLYSFLKPIELSNLIAWYFKRADWNVSQWRCVSHWNAHPPLVHFHLRCVQPLRWFRSSGVMSAENQPLFLSFLLSFLKHLEHAAGHYYPQWSQQHLGLIWLQSQTPFSKSSGTVILNWPTFPSQRWKNVMERFTTRSPSFMLKHWESSALAYFR